MKTKLKSTIVKHFHAQFSFPGAAAVGRPIAVEISNLARASEMFQLRQCSVQDGFIALPMMGRTESAADGVVDKRCARRHDSAHDIVCRADHERWNSCGFDHVGNETDGLVAKRSVGHEQREIDLGLAQFIGDGRREVVFDSLRLPHTAHERKVKGSDAADFSTFGQLGQRRSWKDYLRILLGNSSYTRVMIDNNFSGTRIRRHTPVAQVLTWNKRLLIGKSQRGAAQQSDA